MNGRLDKQAEELLQSARNLGVAEWHGWQVAKRHQEDHGNRHPMGFGTLYRVLERLEQTGRVTSRLEPDPLSPADAPRTRRMYSVVDHLDWIIRARQAWPQLSLVLETVEELERTSGWAYPHQLDKLRAELKAEIEALMAECGRPPLT
jgi:DNA-binding PadR family transcriptional regulator